MESLADAACDIEPDSRPSAVVVLELLVRDPEIVAELSRRAQGPERDAFALAALRLGVLAIRQAGGALDTAAIQREVERMLAEVDKLVCGNANVLAERIAASLKEYFDPGSGKLSERLDRLVRKDGELSSLLAGHLEGDSSSLVQTLVQHVGTQSPIFQLLSPTQKDGLLAQVAAVLDQALAVQRSHILREFSLDDSNSALSRLAKSLADGNGKLRDGLTTDLKAVQREFSLDNKDGALSRLTALLEGARAAVQESLTLDNEDSPLSRLRGELMKLLKELAESSQRFQGEVRQTLETFKVRRDEAAHGTRHGREFEALAGEILAADARQAGDTFDAVGDTVGCLPRSKVGDHLLILGPDSRAAGARIVIECKERADYTEAYALQEIDLARRNRDAQIGLFIFSKATAPPGLSILRRLGSDILCLWDKDDPQSDLVLKAALSVARALAVRQRVVSEQTAADLTEMEKAIAQIDKQADHLSQVRTWAENVERDGRKIRELVSPMMDLLKDQTQRLGKVVGDLKRDSADSAT